MTSKCDQIIHEEVDVPASDAQELAKCDGLYERLSALAKDPPDSVTLDFALDLIAQDYSRPMGVIDRLYKSIKAEHQEQLLGDCSLSDLEELSAAAPAEGETVDLIPPQLKAGFSSVQETVGYDDHLMLAVLLVGCRLRCRWTAASSWIAMTASLSL